MTIWMATEYVLTDEHPVFGEAQNIGVYSSEKNAILAIYTYLRNDFKEEDITNHVRMEQQEDRVKIITECGDKYGMYDCYYDIMSVELDRKFGE